ncbi:NADH-quinone oxidoreductase subunit NuoE [Calorimonas adulescens]|uniref:NADH-quinone oxidoreductase subunit NuoE n=2 Tax=Calorimonas adulescens TaxID=2606906 RepID=A0A5D8QDP1_9THEO|nr:NADH-quinone oxidoreductase subunit NuoE [Calorimonas adulescens]
MEDEIDLSLIEPILEEYGDDKGSLITILQETQAIYNYLPAKALTYIAERMGISEAQVYGVATFYAQFRFRPVGKYLIMCCQGTACHVNGSENILTALEDELGIKVGETTDDKLFTIESVACLGCCSLAPVMMVNGQAYGQLTLDRVKEIIADYRSRG